MKGTAGNIGARGVQAAAEALELACNEKVPADRIAELLQKTLAELAPVIAGLQTVGAAEAAPVPAPAPAAKDTAKLMEGVHRLKTLLEDSDSEAGDLIEELTELAKGLPMAGVLKRVAAAVEDFEFDIALEILAKQ
ncbi:MAG: hypothetical protein HQL37_12870 [Alphaproteobacteria bacterium]|nr:hypothetical protein [Alphaproteobacteria bacterium]